MEPTDDITPLRAAIVPDPYVDDRFPCPHCGKPVRCPPVARVVKPAARALDPLDGYAPELEPDVGPLDATRIIALPPNAPD